MGLFDVFIPKNYAPSLLLLINSIKINHYFIDCLNSMKFMIENNEKFDKDDKKAEGTAFQRAYLDGKIGDWMKVNCDENVNQDGNDAWVAGIAYKGAKANKPGSYGLAVKYFDYGFGTSLRNGFNAYTTAKNFKTMFAGEGIAVGGYYTVAKNIVAGVEYYNFNEKFAGTDKIANCETLWTQLIFSF